MAGKGRKLRDREKLLVNRAQVNRAFSIYDRQQKRRLLYVWIGVVAAIAVAVLV